MRGVPQGSIISPILYSLYVYDFSTIHPNVIQYADDSTIMIQYKSKNDLQTNIAQIGMKIEEYMANRNLVLNEEKTEIILFNSDDISDLLFMNKVIQISKVVKFLGVHISHNRMFHDHILITIIPKIRQTYPTLFLLSKVISKVVKIVIFYSFILPLILYAIPFIKICNKIILFS